MQRESRLWMHTGLALAEKGAAIQAAKALANALALDPLQQIAV
jgi:hypothetical protein